MSPLTPAERQEALAFLRATLGAHLAGLAEPPPPRKGPFCRPRACFVTLRVRQTGELRGCIGQTEARAPLGEALADSAISSATRDPRFAPVAASELDALAIQVSILGPMERIHGPSEIEVGRHGIFLRQGMRTGLLLPQVAVEAEWDAPEFLEHLCGKADLPPGSWKDPAARLWRFAAEVFGDVERQG